MVNEKPEPKTHLINEVARKVGLSQKRIREYEKEGLVRPSRDPRTNNRIFNENDIQRVQRIKQLIHEHGFTLSCLKYFMSSAPCWIIYDCEGKLDCPVYQSPEAPCYEIMQSIDVSHKKNCRSCSVYLNRKSKSFSLFSKPK
jgi:hypothetical protein